MAHAERFPFRRPLLCTCPTRTGLWGVETVDYRDDCPGAVTHPRVLTAEDMRQILASCEPVGPDYGREMC